MKFVKFGLSAFILFSFLFAGFSPPAVPQSSNAMWVEVAKTRAALKARTDENLVRQFSYDDLKTIHKIGSDALETVISIQDLLKDSGLPAEELVRAALRESNLKGEERFRMKIILERVISAVEMRGNNPPEPY